MHIKELAIILLCSVAIVGCKTKRRIIPTDGYHVQGTALYEKAKINNLTLSTALFGSTEQTPIPDAVVYVVDTTNSNEVITIGRTDATGYFNISLPKEYETTALAVQVHAISADSYLNVRVQPHGSGVDPYYTQSDPFVGTTVDLPVLATRDNNTGRIAGAFNIFAQMIKGINFVRDKAEPDTQFPELRVHWALNQLGINCTCYVQGNFFNPRLINIPDSAADDEDSDDDVLMHELGHYMHEVFSDTDSPGGQHNISCSQNQNLDLRLAYGEGWANAFAMMVLEHERYVDTQPTGGFFFTIETPCAIQSGPRSEVIVAAMFLDLYDGETSGFLGSDSDGISLSFSQIWEAFKDTSNTNVNVYDFFVSLRSKGLVTTDEWNDAFAPLGLDEAAMIAADSAGI